MVCPTTHKYCNKIGESVDLNTKEGQCVKCKISSAKDDCQAVENPACKDGSCAICESNNGGGGVA